MAHSVEVAKWAVHFALAAVKVGLAEAVAVLVVTERGAVGGAGALLGAVHSERARRTGIAVARHVVTTMADGAVAHRVAALAVSVHVAPRERMEDIIKYMAGCRRDKCVKRVGMGIPWLESFKIIYRDVLPSCAVKALPPGQAYALAGVGFAAAVLKTGTGVGAVGAPVPVLATDLGARGAAEPRIAGTRLGLDARSTDTRRVAHGLADSLTRGAERDEGESEKNFNLICRTRFEVQITTLGEPDVAMEDSRHESCQLTFIRHCNLCVCHPP